MGSGKFTVTAIYKKKITSLCLKRKFILKLIFVNLQRYILLEKRFMASRPVNLSIFLMLQTLFIIEHNLKTFLNCDNLVIGFQICYQFQLYWLKCYL